MAGIVASQSAGGYSQEEPDVDLFGAKGASI
jgi:hypothetical protein